MNLASIIVMAAIAILFLVAVVITKRKKVISGCNGNCSAYALKCDILCVQSNYQINDGLYILHPMVLHLSVYNLFKLGSVFNFIFSHESRSANSSISSSVP